MRTIKYSITQDKFEDGLPTFYVLKKIYYFGFYFCGQLYGIDGTQIAFQDFESAKNYKETLENYGK